jgi:hypothetical protein
VAPGDHHTEYLARTVAALTPEGHARVDELLDQLGQAAGNREWLVRFAKARREEADEGHAARGEDPARHLTRPQLEALAAGFMTIRDEEPREDVASWANAVLALLKDAVAE